MIETRIRHIVPLVKVIERLLLIAIISCVSLSANAGLLDKVKEKISEKFSSGDSKDAAALQSSYDFSAGFPSHWRQSIQREPVFGSEIFVVEVGDQSKPTVILVHGLGQVGLLDWQNVIPALEDQYHLVAFDLPGFGRSAVPPGKYSPTNYAKIIHWLKQRYSIEPITLIGHSMGGAVSLRFAADYPASVRELILVDAAGILHRTAFVKHAAYAQSAGKISESGRAIDKAIDWSQSAVEFVIAGPDPTKWLSKNNTAWNALFSGMPNANAGLAMIDENFSEAVSKVEVPTKIIWGELDPVAPLRTAKVLKKMMANASLNTLPAAAHVPMNSHPNQFNQMLLSVLGKPVVPSKMLAVDSTSKGDVSCNNESGKRYTGIYNLITIKKCTGVILTNVKANKIVISDSLVELDSVDVESSELAMKIKDSAVTMTNVSIATENGIYISDSRLDAAGLEVVANNYATKVKGESRLIFSVSKFESKYYQGHVHGDFKVHKKIFDKKLN